MQVQRSVNGNDYEEGMDSKLNMMSSKGMETRYYEGCGREGPIRCIFLGEFHPVAGPKISCQFPEDYISKEVFDSISAYIIPKPLIQKSTMTINASGHKIVGYPIRIDNSRYERNVYVFNLCFVCDSWSKTVQYEPVVKKLGEHLTIMEEETRFVSSGSSKLPTMLAHLLHDLNTHRKATIVGVFHSVHLGVFVPFDHLIFIYLQFDTFKTDDVAKQKIMEERKQNGIVYTVAELMQLNRQMESEPISQNLQTIPFYIWRNRGLSPTNTPPQLALPPTGSEFSGQFRTILAGSISERGRQQAMLVSRAIPTPPFYNQSQSMRRYIPRNKATDHTNEKTTVGTNITQ